MGGRCRCPSWEGPRERPPARCLVRPSGSRPAGSGSPAPSLWPASPPPPSSHQDLGHRDRRPAHPVQGSRTRAGQGHLCVRDLTTCSQFCVLQRTECCAGPRRQESLVPPPEVHGGGLCSAGRPLPRVQRCPLRDEGACGPCRGFLLSARRPPFVKAEGGPPGQARSGPSRASAGWRPGLEAEGCLLWVTALAQPGRAPDPGVDSQQGRPGVKSSDETQKPWAATQVSA